MRKNHTLTFNETTYIINDGKLTNSIFINGQETDWFIEYDVEKIDGEHFPIPKGIRLKNRNDDNPYTFYLYLNTTHLQFHDVVYIIKTINEESSRNN